MIPKPVYAFELGSIELFTTEMATLEKASSTEQQVSVGDVRLGETVDLQNLNALGYKAELRRNRSMFTLLFQSLAIAAVCISSSNLHYPQGIARRSCLLTV